MTVKQFLKMTRWTVLLTMFILPLGLQACTIVMTARSGLILFGNNEDWSERKTKMWFEPGENGEYGRVCFGFSRDFGFAQGGMNEKGLAIDANALRPTGWESEPGKPPFPDNLMDYILAHCATLDDVIQLFTKYNSSSLARARFPVADATGASMVVEWADGKVRFIKRTGDFQIATNFVIHPVPDGPYPCWRYNKANNIFKKMDRIAVEEVRQVLDATHQEGQYPTVYSNIYDLKKRTFILYHFHDFEKPLHFNLMDELEKGRRSVDIPSLFTKKDN